MMHHGPSLFRAFGTTLATSLATVILLIFATQIGPIIERSSFPVVGEFSVVGQRVEGDGSIAFQGQYAKYRMCKLKSLTWYSRINNVTTPITLTIETDGPPLNPRPVGYNITNWFRLPKAVQPPVTIVGVVEHDCHLPWTTVSEFGPWELK